jgi:FkbM family methyltransferase
LELSGNDPVQYGPKRRTGLSLRGSFAGLVELLAAQGGGEVAEQTSSDDMSALAEAIRKSPDARKAVEQEIRKRLASAPTASGNEQALPAPAALMPSSLGTDVGRFRAAARRNRYEEDQMRLVLATVLTTNSNAIDVGAHGGTVLQDLVRFAPQGRHVAYEPLPVHAGRLARLFPTVDVRQVALSDKEGEASFVHVTTLSPWSGLRRRPYPSAVGEGDLEQITVRVERLDDSLPAGYVPSLIKVDVEGAEEWVLRGALNTLRAHRPVVVFEHSVSGCWSYGTTSASLYRLLSDEAGFRIFDLAGDGPYTLSEFEESQRQLRWVNYLGRP